MVIPKDLELLSVAQVAKLLNSTPKSIYSWLSRGKFPEYVLVRLGRKVLFIKHLLLEWILSGGSSKMN